uniref:Uncharacterized protein n=1 Tax=Gasterosteus aculeatus TaxID=69293 RepID=G3Q0S9_GASAC
QRPRLLAPGRADQRHVSDPPPQPEGRLRRDRVRLAEETHQGHLQPRHPDRKERPLFCGGRQSHDGALQSGGGGVGEDPGLLQVSGLLVANKL